MQKYDWSKFRKKISVDASVQEVYNAWTTREALEKWFLSKAIFERKGIQLEANEPIRVNDTYRWYWYGFSDDVTETGVIFAANGTDRLTFSFSGKSDVSVHIYTEAGETVVELVQENIPVDEASIVKYHLGCSEGWTFYLANLKSYFEGGKDLRNRNIELRGVINS